MSCLERGRAATRMIHHSRANVRDTCDMADSSMEPLSEGADLVPLVEAAAVLDVHRATVNEMVRDGRLRGHRIGPHWFVDRDELMRFRETYSRPKNSPKRLAGSNHTEKWIEQLVERLLDWDDATVDELAQVIDLHPGNIRKYLNLAEARGLVQRDEFGSWRLVAGGDRVSAFRLVDGASAGARRNVG